MPAIYMIYIRGWLTKVNWVNLVLQLCDCTQSYVPGNNSLHCQKIILMEVMTYSKYMFMSTLLVISVVM